MATYTAEQITAIGGREWTSRDGRHHRVYVNAAVWAPMIGLNITYHRTGNVSNATLDGRQLSNRCGESLQQAKVYLDVATGTLHTDLGKRAADDYLDGDALVAQLHAGIAAVTAPALVELTTAQAAEALGVSVRTVQRRAQAGRLAGRKDSRGRWIVTL